MVQRWSLPRWPEIIVWGLLTGLAFAWSASDYLPDFGGDAAVYWLTANHWSPYGTPSPMAAEIAATSKYPLLYPALLAMFGGGTSLRAAHYVTAGFLIAGLLCLRTYYRRLGFPPYAAAAVAWLVALLPGLRWELLDLHSESLYLGLSAATLALTVENTERLQSMRWRIALGILVGAAMLTRTVGIVLLIALVLHSLMRRNPRLLEAIIVASLVWWLGSINHNSTATYFAEFQREYAAGMNAFLSSRWDTLRAGWIETLAGREISSLVVWLLLALFAISLSVAIARAGRGCFDGLYVLGYLAVVTLWPYPAETARLLMVVAPVMLGQTCAGLRTLWAPHAGLHAAVVPGFILLLSVLVIPDLIRVAVRFATPVPRELQAFKRLYEWYEDDPRDAVYILGLYGAMHRSLIQLNRLVTPAQCVFGTKPAIVALFSGRRAFPPPLPTTGDVTFRTEVRDRGCRHFFMMNTRSPTFPDQLYPYDRLKPELKLLHVAQNATFPKITAAVIAEWIPASSATESTGGKLPDKH